MKRFVFVLVLFGGLLLHPTLVSAHAGPGPPFLRVNGKFAQTNPYYQGDAAFNVPQDIAPEKYLPAQMVRFEVDTSQLLVPPDIAAQTKFRWTLITGQKFMDTEHTSVPGQGISRSFDHPGSYLLQLEAEGPGDYTYTIIDTVQVDIVPNKSYKTPNLTIDVSTHVTHSFTAQFSADTKVDPSSKKLIYLWDLGDKQISTGSSQSKDYASSSPINYLYARVIDSNGLLTDVGFDVWKTDTTIEYHPFGNMLHAPIIVMTKEKLANVSDSGTNNANNHSPLKGFLIGSGVLLVLILGFAFMKPKKVS